MVWYEGESSPYIHSFDKRFFKDETFNFYIQTDFGERIIHDMLIKDEQDLSFIMDNLKILYDTDEIVYEHEFETQVRLSLEGKSDSRYKVELLPREGVMGNLDSFF